MKQSLAWMGIVLLALAAESCSESHPHAPGSQTHFLQVCSTSCAAPYDCICGVCTLSCSRDTQCADHAAGAECTATPTGDGAQCGGESQMCDVTCTSDGDCKPLGEAFACSAGRCRAVPMSIDTGVPDAGKQTMTSTGMGTSDSGTPPDAAVVVLDSGPRDVDSGPITTDAGMSTPICDGSKDFRLGVFNSGGFFEPQGGGISFMQPFRSFVAIDGECHFYASLNPMKGIVAGTLNVEDATQLASDVEWIMFTAFGKYMKYSPQCADGGGYVTGDGTHSFACLCDCDPAAPPILSRSNTAALNWLMRLADDGMGLDGPVSAVATVFSGGTPPAGDPQAWPLLTPITDIVSDSQDNFGDGTRFDDPGDAMMLRAMRSKALADSADARQIYVTDGTQQYLLYLRDELDSATNSRLGNFQSAVLTSSP